MNDDREQSGAEPSKAGFAVGDIYFVLFRHKWLIILSAAVSVLGAVTVCVIKPPRYRTEAKLFIRYVEAGKTLAPPGNDSNTRTLNDQEGDILVTEAQILRSMDVAQQVAVAVGPEKILAKVGGGTDRDQAASVVLGFLEVEPPRGGSVISVLFEHPDREVAREVLNQILIAYFKKHREMHQPAGLFGDVLTKEVERLRAEHDQTEQKLKTAKIQAGVTDLNEAKKAYTEQISKTRGELFTAQAELAEHQAALEEINELVPGGLEATNTEPRMSEKVLEEYTHIRSQLDLLAGMERERRRTYKENTLPITEIREQIAEAEKRKRKLEEENPWLASRPDLSTRPAAQPAGASAEPKAESIQIRALKSKTNALNLQLVQIQAEAAKVGEMETTILELQRTKELQEANLKYFSGNLEQSRIEKAIGAGDNALNMGIVQAPSFPVKGWSKPFKKKLKMVAIGPAACGLALAFLIELFLDRSVKRPGEVETKLRLPLFISIPDLGRNGSRRLAEAAARNLLLLTDAKGGRADKERSAQNGLMPVAIRDRNHPLRCYYEGLRDRLIVNFEGRNLTQKPKLVAVTSCGKGVGVTTVAAGLAASLSETGDGTVLLVDMNDERGASQEFFKGEPGCKLDAAVNTGTMMNALVQANPCDAAERLNDDKLPRVLPPQFASLMPKLKASHYDYIVFDMPPVSQTSMTPRLARIMDMVLLVIESEKTSQDVVKQATALLAESKAIVSAVLNKTRRYVPAWLHRDFLDEA